MCSKHPDGPFYPNGKCAACNREAVKAWRKINPNKRKRYGRGSPINSILNNARCRAKERGIEFNLTREDIAIPEVCPVLGIKLEFGNGFAKPNSPSLDRINPNKGYVKGNVAVISYKANTIKSNATVAEVEAVVAYMKAEGTS